MSRALDFTYHLENNYITIKKKLVGKVQDPRHNIQTGTTQGALAALLCRICLRALSRGNYESNKNKKGLNFFGLYLPLKKIIIIIKKKVGR